jgi:GAF domain-containing protein
VRAEPGSERPAEVGRAGFVASQDADLTRLEQLAQVIAELAAAETMESVVEVVVSHVADAVRAAVTGLMLREDDELNLVASRGLGSDVERRWRKFALTDNTPASEAARTGVPVVMAGTDRIEARYPVLGSVPAERSVVCLPLSAGEKPLGVLALTFDESWVPGPHEMAFLNALADSCAQAIRQIRAMEDVAEKAQQLSFLADASAELAASLDYRTTLAKVAQLAVRTLADWCAVDVVQDGVPVTLSVAHADPAKVAWAWELQERYPPDPNAATGAANVIRTGLSEIYPDITDEMLVAGARDDEHLRLARSLNLSSAMSVPLNARGRTLGAITLLRAGPTRRYGPAELAIAEDLGRRAGTAIDNARLYQQTQDVALQLQRAVLPDNLTMIDGWQIAVHYSPGGNAEVGGDFYDAIPLANGRLAIFIGDVVGHGLAAAAAMAQMRAAIRAYLSIDSEPGIVVANLDQMFVRLPISRLVSLVYAILDPETRELTVVNAGHYPPLLVAADGTARLAQCSPQRPLGAGGDVRTATVWPLDKGETVLLYTDGLIERRGEIIDAGLDRLRVNATTLTEERLQSGLAKLIQELHYDEGADDITAVAVRLA